MSRNSTNRWNFDFSQFDRFVRLCLDAGIRDHIEAWSPLVQPGSDHSIVTYTDTTANQSRKLRLAAGSTEYKLVWGTFVRAFQEHLRKQGWLDKTYLAFDEIKSGVLDLVVPLFHETAPELNLMISGGDEEGRHMAESRELAFHYGYYTAGSGAQLPDIAGAAQSGEAYSALHRRHAALSEHVSFGSAGVALSCLGCLEMGLRRLYPVGLELLAGHIVGPAVLHLALAICFLYTLARDGPVDSIRWEMLRQGLQDYECLWLARKGADDLARGAPFRVHIEESGILARAVELATQQFDRNKIPRDPIPAQIDEARRMVNQVLIELDGQRPR